MVDTLSVLTSTGQCDDHRFEHQVRARRTPSPADPLTPLARIRALPADVQVIIADGKEEFVVDRHDLDDRFIGLGLALDLAANVAKSAASTRGQIRPRRARSRSLPVRCRSHKQPPDRRALRSSAGDPLTKALIGCPRLAEVPVGERTASGNNAYSEDRGGSPPVGSPGEPTM